MDWKIFWEVGQRFGCPGIPNRISMLEVQRNGRAFKLVDSNALVNEALLDLVVVYLQHRW